MRTIINKRKVSSPKEKKKKKILKEKSHLWFFVCVGFRVYYVKMDLWFFIHISFFFGVENLISASLVYYHLRFINTQTKSLKGEKARKGRKQKKKDDDDDDDDDRDVCAASAMPTTRCCDQY